MSAVEGLLRGPAAVLVLLVGLVVQAPAAGAAEATVTDVRVAQHDQRTRVVLDLDKGVPFTLFTLADPYRVVIDMPEVGWRLPGNPLPGRTGAFERLRYGLFKPGTSRVVVDMTGPARVNEAFMMAPLDGHGYRLVLDLVPTSRQAFLKRAGVKQAVEKDAGVRNAAADGGDRPEPAAPAAARSRVKPVRMSARLGLPLGPPPRKPEREFGEHVVVIDPGHGGVDPGAIGVSGIYEKHIVLAVAREAKRQLEASGRFKVLMTRDRDVFVRLKDRVRFAREAGAELFISIHADTIKKPSVRGLSVYTVSEKASDSVAAQLAESENKADMIAGVDLTGQTREVTDILVDLARRETMNESARFAGTLVDTMDSRTKLLGNTHRFAGFVVLKAPDVASVLVELGFLSNRHDERALRRKDHRVRLARGIADAVGRYFHRIEQAQRR